MTDHPHFTTRRGVIAALGFGGTTLYGLWVAYGAAPGPLALFATAPAGGNESAATGHGGHGSGAAASTEGFEAEVRDFVARFGQPDGSVWPRPDHAMELPGMAVGDMPAMAGMDHGAHGGAPDLGGGLAQSQADPAMPRAEDAAIDVWFLASRFQFEPAHLMLETGRRYRFRMLASDVAHGASIQFGHGSRMIRLRPGRVTETELVFSRPGEFLVYCSFYCGPAHDAMQGRLTIINRQEGAA